MKLLLTVLTFLAVTLAALAETCDLVQGTIEVPDGYVFEKGATDSILGKITRKSDGFTIRFDVGGMAGIHMHDGMKAQCTYYRTHQVNGLPAITGIESLPAGRKITISIGDALKLRESPANFWTDIRQDTDIADFLLIVTTYKYKASTYEVKAK